MIHLRIDLAKWLLYFQTQIKNLPDTDKEETLLKKTDNCTIQKCCYEVKQVKLEAKHSNIVTNL